MAEKGRSEYRVDQQPAFVLHTYPWRDESYRGVFTRDYGRIPLVARGAKRPMSQYRGLLNPFCPLAVSYSGKGEVKILRARMVRDDTNERKVLMSAFYINELLVRLCLEESRSRHYSRSITTRSKLAVERITLFRSATLNVTFKGVGLCASFRSVSR